MNIYKLGWEEHKKHRIKRRIEQSIAQEFDAMFGKGTAKKVDKLTKGYDPAKEAHLEEEEEIKLRKYADKWVQGGHTVSRKDYCAIHGLFEMKFRYWARRRRRELKKSAPEGGI